MMVNLRSPSVAESQHSPFQQFTGRTPDSTRDFPALFGDLVVYEAQAANANDKSNVLRSRTKFGMWLRPAFDDHASSLVLDFTTLRVTKQVNISVVVWVPEHNDKLLRLYAFAGTKSDPNRSKEVLFENDGVAVDLLKVQPERETDNEESFFGVSKLAYPMPTRHESEDSLPEGGVVQAVADVDNFLIQAVQEAEASAAVQVKIIEALPSVDVGVPR